MKGGTSSSNRGQQTTSKTEKQSPQGKYQPTAEQVRYAQLLNDDDPGWLKDKIQEVVDLTQKPQDEVAIALHDCDNNVDTAIINLLEGKYNQGEWTTFQSRKKKSPPADTISPVGPKDKTGNSRQDRKENRDGGGLSQSVEYNNRRNKGQLDRISDGNNERQNGPLNSTRPPGGVRKWNRDDRDDRRGGQDDQRGDRENRRDDRRSDRDNRRDRGGNQGEQADDRRNRNDFRDRDRNDRGSRGGRGDREDRRDQSDRSDRGDRGGDRGDRWVDRGDRGGDRGDRDNRGERGGDRWNNGDRSGDRGDRRFGGRGGFNRRGGMGRGGRGASRGSRGGKYPNNRSGGRRSDQVNGPSKDNEFPKTTESCDVSPGKDEKDLNVDWGLPEPTGTTEDWGAEDWGSDKQNDTSNTPSWATTVDDKTASTWETDVPANQNLTNHMNHLPECDDDAILSSKVASKQSPLLNHEESVRFSTASNVSSQPYPLDTQKSFGLPPDISSSQPKGSAIAALANAGLKKMHHPPAMDASRSHTSASQVTSSPEVTMTADTGQPQPQRQQKSRTKRAPKGQIPKQAVEMPGNNGGMDSLDVQFGNLEFGGDLMTKPEEVRVIQKKEESMPLSSAGNVSVPKPAVPAAVVTTVSPTGPKPVTMATTSMTSESAVVNTYEQRSPRHYPPPGTPVSKSAMTQITPEPSPRKEKVEVREPKTPPMTKKVDVSTSPMPLTNTMSIAKNNNEGVASRATSLHSQIEAIATSDERLDERVHQQAPAIRHSPSPHTDQNAMRSRLTGGGVSSATATRPNPTPPGVSLSSSGSAGPPPGIITGIQPTATGPPKTSSSNVNRQTAHGTKPPNLPPGVMPLYGMQPAPGFAGFSPLGYPVDDIQMIQRMQMQPPYHYDMSFPVTGRDGVQNSFSGTDVKYNRNDTSSPVPSTLTAGPHGQQAPFMNTHAQLHPFGYAGNLAFYHGGGMIGGFAAPYTTQMYQLPTKGPGVTTQFQQNFGNQLGPHYTSGYDGLSNAHDFGKQGYQHPAQSKPNPVSGSTASNSASDLSTYKTQFADKGYLSGTPPPLNISLPGQGHQHHPAGFPLMPVLAPTQHPPSLFASHHISHQQQLDSLNQNRGAQNQGKVSQNKSHHGQSIYPPQYWSGTN